jgi:glutathione S-transferase
MQRWKLGSWLAGNTFSLADNAYAPYLTRFSHLGLGDIFIERPRLRAWRDRLFGRSSYKSGVQDWFNPAYLEIFAAQQDAAREQARAILAE